MNNHKREPRLTQPIGGRRMPSCRGLKTVNGVPYAYFIDKGKTKAMPLAEFLAHSGAKVRA